MIEQKESEIWLGKGGKLLLDCMESLYEISEQDMSKFNLLITGFLHAKSVFLASTAISSSDPNAEEWIRQIKILDDEVFENLIKQRKNKIDDEVFKNLLKQPKNKIDHEVFENLLKQYEKKEKGA